MQERLTQWLNARGITDSTIESFNLSEVDHPILGPGALQIPVHLPDGTFSFNKYRRNPFTEGTGAKYIYDKGGRTALYGADKLPHHKSLEQTMRVVEEMEKKLPEYNTATATELCWLNMQPNIPAIVITEGELDTLVLHSMNIPAVSSTGGAQSFQEEFTPVLAGMTVYLCFDNDEAGAKGMVKTLEHLPNAKIILLPLLPDCKDITDYISRGGDFHSLMRSAKSYPSVESVKEDMLLRKGQMLPTTFHKAYLEKHDAPVSTYQSIYVASEEQDEVKRKAKEFPCTEILAFTKHKAHCPLHNEKTPSLHYYPKTNSAYCFGGCGKSFDSIELYRAVHGVTFMEALKALSN